MTAPFQRPFGTRWTVTPTVHSDRKNVFAFVGDTGAYQVGTLVSGSKTSLDRFEADGRLIAASPRMLAALKLANGMLKEWERRADDEDDAQATFNAFIGGEDCAECWATIRSAIKEAEATDASA
jgi:hypothetical protein